MREADANPMFLQDEPLHRLIGSFYDAASGQSNWTGVCDELCDAFDLWAVQILGIYKNNGALIFSFEGGRIAPEVWLDYITRYHAINPRMAAAALLQGEDWAHDHELLDEEFVASDPFYQELLIPYGARWVSGTKLIEDDEFVVFLGLHRGVDSTPLTPADIERFAPLRPHLVRALRLHMGLRRQAQSHFAGQALLDVLPQGTLMIDETRLIQYRNPVARTLLDSGGPLRERAGFLDCIRPSDNRALAAAIHALGLSGSVTAGSGTKPDIEPAKERTVIRIGGASAGDEHLVFAMAVRPERTMQMFGDTSFAILIVHPLDANASLDPLVIGLAFNLTPAEARVATAIAEGKTLEDVARDRRVSIATVRSQLQVVFGKMGVNRQAEMVRLLLEMPRFNPLERQARGSERADSPPCAGTPPAGSSPA